MSVVGECFFWYRLTRVVPDNFHRAVKRLCCVCVKALCYVLLFVLQAAHLSFQYSVKDERDTGVEGQWDRHSTELEPTRTVSIVAADKLPVILAEMSQLYSVSST